MPSRDDRVVRDWGPLHGRLYDEYVEIHEDTDSVRSPGWFEATCNADSERTPCWSTSGGKPSVEEAAGDHVARTHLVFADPHLPVIGRRGTVSWGVNPGPPAFDAVSVDVCGLDQCTESALSYVSFVTGCQGTFGLTSQPMPRQVSSSTLALVVGSVDAIVESMVEEAHRHCPPVGHSPHGCRHATDLWGHAEWVAGRFAPFIVGVMADLDSARADRDTAERRVASLESRLTAVRVALQAYGDPAGTAPVEPTP